MPALSPTMTEGTLTKWLIKVGDQVKAGDVLAEIETDKATMEVEAVDEGKVAKLIVEEGTSNIPVNSTIAILDGDDKDQNEGDQDQTKDTVGKIKKKEILDNNVVKKSSFEKKLGKKIIASPYAKSLAKGVLKKLNNNNIGNSNYNNNKITALENSKQEVNIMDFVRNKSGVCRHRSLLFKYFCDKADIECRLVRGFYSGDSDDPESKDGGHAWNIVKIDNKKYLFDIIRHYKA